MLRLLSPSRRLGLILSGTLAVVLVSLPQRPVAQTTRPAVGAGARDHRRLRARARPPGAMGRARRRCDRSADMGLALAGGLSQVGAWRAQLRRRRRGSRVEASGLRSRAPRDGAGRGGRQRRTRRRRCRFRRSRSPRAIARSPLRRTSVNWTCTLADYACTKAATAAAGDPAGGRGGRAGGAGGRGGGACRRSGGTRPRNAQALRARRRTAGGWRSSATATSTSVRPTTPAIPASR